jgi:hypothetical protein
MTQNAFTFDLDDLELEFQTRKREKSGVETVTKPLNHSDLGANQRSNLRS